MLDSDWTHEGRTMGPAEIVASLKELCAEKGPRIGTEEIVAWMERMAASRPMPS